MIIIIYIDFVWICFYVVLLGLCCCTRSVPVVYLCEGEVWLWLQGLIMVFLVTQCLLLTYIRFLKCFYFFVVSVVFSIDFAYFSSHYMQQILVCCCLCLGTEAVYSVRALQLVPINFFDK